MSELKCWICGRTAEQIQGECIDMPDEDFILFPVNEFRVCLVCSLIIEDNWKNRLVEKISRD